MTITFFNGNRGLLRGKTVQSIVSPFGGVLKIGESTVTVRENVVTKLPILCDGKTGVFKSTFTKDDGTVYDLLDVTVEGGVIVPPSSEYENLALNYKLANSLAESIDEQEKRLQETRIRRQEIVTALNNNPLKYLIE